eukprot:scaffold17636_cov120-Isochrysis_galbana.AAC.11
MVRVPASGDCSPVNMRSSVVLPAPFGPTMPTIAPGGIEKDRSSMSVRDPNFLTTFFASITCSN